MTDATVERPQVLGWSSHNCSIARALEVVGERWTLVVLRELFQGVRRFEDLRVRTDIPRQVLSDRLKSLVERGLLHRVPYRDQGQRRRHEYRLTEAGLALYPVLAALMAWGDCYLADPQGPAVVLEHRGCSEPVHLEMRCSADHVLRPREVGSRPGPGARRV